MFNTSIGPDTTAPVVTVVTPPPGSSGVKTNSAITATFNEAMDAATITASSVLLRTGAGATVPATVTYAAAAKTATLTPTSALAYSTPHTIVVKGGATAPRVTDLAGNALASDYVSSFTTAAPPPPPPTQGTGGPVLVVTATANPFTTYYAEILRTEGMNAFATADISAVTAATLASYDAVILGEMPLTAAQVSMFSTWVTGGGNLIAMKPDKQLAGLLGLIDTGSTLSNAYLLVNTTTGPGAGIVSDTIQYHGTADLYTVSDATTLATLYSTVAAATSSPAVTSRPVGAGRAVAFTYPLAQSIIYTRQGNPAWAGQDRDGLAPIRSDDLFFGNKTGDVQPDWVNLNKVAIPQADEQQRFLWNILLTINAGKKPLPRFWYFPRMLKAVVIMTGDDHANGGTAGRFDTYLSRSAPGCSVADWGCIRGTSYLFPGTPLSDVQAQSYVSQGFEIALHVNTNCGDWTTSTLSQFYSTQLSQFATGWPNVPAPVTNRTHCIVWSDYATQPQVELTSGIRFDTNYYYWPDVWVQDRPGMYTGSGMPMRFTTATGQMIDVYQATSQLTDESAQTWPKNIDTLLNNAIGPLGYYGAFTANMHTDFNPSAGSIGSDAIVASAQARGVPVVSAKQMLDWLDGRNASRFDNISWTGSVLSFTVEVGAGANGLQMLLPATAGVNAVAGITLNGVSVGFTLDTIKGVQYAIVPAGAGPYQVSYGPDIAAPVITGVSANAGVGSAVVTWVTNEPSESAVDYSTDAGSLINSTSDSLLVTSHTVTLTGLAARSTYYYRVRSADAARNSTTVPGAANSPLSFTTQAAVLRGSVGASGTGTVLTLSGAAAATATADGAGNYTFTGLGNGAYTVTPSKNGLAFSPASRSVTVNGADVTGVDFTAQPIVITGTITPVASGAGATMTLSGPAALTTTVDTAGTFTFSSLADGVYTLTPTKAGFAFTPTARSVTIAGASAASVNFTAAAIPTWTISGTLSPAAAGGGATLTVTGGATVTADGTGNYAFTGLPDGTYTVTPARPGYAFTPAAQSVTVAGANVSAVNFTVAPVTITGAISPGDSGSGATLTMTGGATATADAAGGFAFSAVPNGTYVVTPSKNGFTFTPSSQSVTIIAGVSAANVNFTIQAIPNRRISGSITPASSGSGATVTLTGGATVTADGLGNYTFTGLADGVYTVTPAKPGFTFAPASQSVTVSNVDVSGVNFAAQPVTLSGVISPVASGAGTSVTLTGPAAGTVTADAAGAFSFSGLPNGTYTVTPAKSGVTFTPSNRSVVISGGVSATGVDFVVVATFTVTGSIAPAASGNGTTLTLSGGGTATADASGAYTFSGVADGSYTITPSKAGFTFTPTSQAVTVNGANVSGVAFTAAPVTITGSITPAASGSGTTVTLTGGMTTTADATGAFTFTAVANGTFTVTPSKTGFSFTPANRSVTIANGVSVSGVAFTAAATAAITIDVTKTAGRSARGSSIASGAFSTTAGNELLLAFVEASNVDPGATTVTGVTGGGITWALVRRTNTQRGTAEIWRAFAPAVLTSATVTATLSQSAAAAITVVSFKGAATTGTSGSGAIGATGSGSSASGAPTASLVTTRASSFVFGGGNDWDGATARTLGAGQTLVSQFLGTDGDTFWVQRTTNVVAAAGTAVTINDTAPANHQYNLTIVEILPPL